MKILVTGGGTAGHVFPLINIAGKILQKEDSKLIFVGTASGIERKIAQDFKIPYRSVLAGKRRNYFSFANLWDLLKTFFGIIQGFFILLSFRPDVIFAKGGYVTVPIIFWTRFFKIPLIIHESDVIVGRANLWAAKFAKKICLGFPIDFYHQDLPEEKLIYTGIPVEDVKISSENKENERLKLLITGGSQGSQKINSILIKILPALLDKYEVIHFAGKTFRDELGKIESPYYHHFEFSYNLREKILESDLIVSRAGANTLAEISAAKKAAIIIPFPYSSGNHQIANAKIFAQKNAAVVLTEKNLSASDLIHVINSLMKDKAKRKSLGENASFFYNQDSADIILEEIYKVANDKV